MAEKIFDIVPPQKFKREEKVREERPSLPPLKKPAFLKRGLVLALVALAGLGILFFWGLSRAEIEVWPQTETLSMSEQVLIDVDFSSQEPGPRLKENRLPGRFIEVEEEVSQEFSTEGRKVLEERAQGTIRVFNAHSTSPLTLVANTRFVSAQGKLFRSAERITVPGAKYEGKKLVAGSLDIVVKASEPGEEYNIKPTTFSLPGLLGTPLYTNVYAQSFSAMTGGSREETAAVEERELQRAQASSEKEVLIKAQASLEKKAKEEGFIFLKDLTFASLKETSCSVQEGAMVDSFSCQTKAKVKLLTFKESDLGSLAQERVLSQIKEIALAQIEGGKNVDPGSLKMNYSLLSSNLERGRANLSLEASMMVYSKLDPTSLKKGVAGRSLKEAQVLLENQTQIERAKIKLWPFWLKTIPGDIRKIQIKLNLS